MSSAPPRLVLASGSASRRTLLAAAGVAFTAEAPAIDEDAVKRALKAEGAPLPRAAAALAELKARRVSARHPAALVLGADSMLECEGRWFDKARDTAEARRHLRFLAGREHRHVTAAVLMREETLLWQHVEEARLAMRTFGEAFLDGYLAAVGEAVCASVGCYQLEGRGLQLFERIEGEYHGILGLPLLAVLGQLRRYGALAS